MLWHKLLCLQFALGNQHTHRFAVSRLYLAILGFESASRKLLNKNT